ncbi:cysteine-rich CWC family protein [Ideonella sp. 4Y11]|uniref:Cysteine-rich CWC family protein n=1 Tax=Ideonella aquatica TaxID=2824119 RepID=A0A941BP81_9BURK|nr:cysteine-rich CWC family protein [Ideonella aquatica]MBQ0957780.1 cysteine-rich CWC family protein [Ideonella aquatica]
MPTPVDPLLSIDRCPRCGGAFHCGAKDTAPCACTGLTLTPELLAGLRARWSRCLCLACLSALAAGAPLAPGDGPGQGVSRT